MNGNKIAVVIPQHTLFDPQKPYISLGGAGPYIAQYLSRRGDVTLVDQNMISFSEASYQQIALENADIIAFTLIGIPYLSNFFEEAKKLILQGKKVIVGGFGVNMFTKEERIILNKNHGFSKPIPRESDCGEIGEILGGLYTEPNKEELININILDQIPDVLLRRYLNNGISLYLSDGCKFACSFCAANRSKKGNKVTEKYRNLLHFSDELSFYLGKCNKLGIPKLDIYFSNLDLFQTPEKLNLVADIIKQCSQEYGVKINRRGLPTLSSFDDYYTEYGINGLIKLNDSGLQSVGFGVDGYGESVRKKIHKSHNNSNNRPIRIPKICSDAGITPELLMVFCHPGIDNVGSLSAAENYLTDMYEGNRAVPRIHVAKSALPGTEARYSANNAVNRELLLSNAGYGLMLDFLAMPNTQSHPNEKERESFIHFLEQFERKTASWTYHNGILGPAKLHYAIEPEWDEAKKTQFLQLSKGKYDH